MPGSVRSYLRALGPGLVTGASDDDPSGIATYAQAGATTRYSTLWSVVLSLPLMLAVQEICDRTALATGEDLGGLARRRFNRFQRTIIGVLLIALLAANGLNLAADLMAVGQGMKLLHAGPPAIWSAVTGISLSLLMILGSFDAIAHVFKWLCLSLAAYVAVLFAVHISWSAVGRGLLGADIRGTGEYWRLIVAVFGTTISPYLFFWESAHRVEEMRKENPVPGRAVPLRRRSRLDAAAEERRSRVDVFVGMFFAQLVMTAIVIATAATLGSRTTGGHTPSIGSAADAAKALEPLAGSSSSTLFAVGFIGAGVLAVPVLASSGAVGISGLLGKEWGFERTPRQARLFYALITFGTLGGTLLSVVLSNPIAILVLSALVNGVASAPFLVVTMLIADDEKLMGRFRNGWLARVVGWSAVAVMSAAAVTGLVQLL